MKAFQAWAIHAGVSLLTAMVATGAIYDVVPKQYHHQVLTLIPVVFYLLGVKMPTPGRTPDAAPAPSSQGSANDKNWNPFSGR